MQFSVIYSVDVPLGVDVTSFAPSSLEKWEQTEGDELYEFSYLEGRWKYGAHRKWAALLERHDFDVFVQCTGLRAEDVQTLGSIGAPGFGFGWAPAISFCADDQDTIRSAYVTPIPETRKQTLNERDWERVRTVILKTYGRSLPPNEPVSFNL